MSSPNTYPVAESALKRAYTAITTGDRSADHAKGDHLRAFEELGAAIKALPKHLTATVSKEHERLAGAISARPEGSQNGAWQVGGDIRALLDAVSQVHLRACSEARRLNEASGDAASEPAAEVQS